MDRRTFIKSSAAASTVLFSNFNIPKQSIKLKAGIVGTGWWGTDMLIPAMMNTGQYEIIGLCDVDTSHLEKAKEKLAAYQSKIPKTFDDYREMYELSGLDMVVIATPLHWHALQTIDACKKGLHIYLEKPVFYDWREGQMMARAVHDAGIMLQVAFERHQFASYKNVAKYIEQGNAGKIYQVEAQINVAGGALYEKDIPDTLDFGKWCGPAPVLPYKCMEESTKIMWRFIDGYCHGHLYDWGIHHIDSIRNMLGLSIPNSVTAFGGNTRYTSWDTPDHLDVQFEYDGLPVIWHHKRWGSTSYYPETHNGIFLYGDKATLFVRDFGWSIMPAGKNSEKQTFGTLDYNYKEFPKSLEDHFSNLTEAIRKDDPSILSSPIDDANQSTLAVKLADIAYKTGEKIKFDASQSKITNHKSANDYLKREYRQPYVHPFNG